MPDNSETARARMDASAPILLASALVFSLFVYALCAKAYADYPDGDEAMTFLGLQKENVKEYQSWPAYVRFVADTVYHDLGITSVRGFQFLAALLASLGALGVHYLVLTRFRLPKESRVLCLAFFSLLLIVNTELHKYATFAILAYPIRIFAGFLFLYILVATCTSASKIGLPRMILIGVALTAATYTHPILVIPECALFASVILARVVKKDLSREHVKPLLLQFVMLVLLPGIVGTLVVLWTPHREINAPRDTIRHYYFLLNDAFAKNPLGLLEFAFIQLKQLLFYVCLPMSFVYWGQTHWMLSVIPFFLFAVGVFTSLFHRDQTRFGLALFVILDLSSRLAANLASAFPFAGAERYALSQVFSLAILVSLGAGDLILGAARLARLATLGRLTRLTSPLTWSYVCAGAALTAGLVCGGMVATKITRDTASLLRQQKEVARDYGHLQGEVFIVESTTYATLYYYIGPALEKGNQVISIPKMYIPRDITPKALASLVAQTSRVDNLQTVTRLAFDEPNFREAYRAVDARFDEVSRRELLNFAFSKWKATRPTDAALPTRIGISRAIALADGTLNVSGWALAQDPIGRIVLRVGDRDLAVADYPLSRPDIYKAFPEYRTEKSGFEIAGVATPPAGKADSTSLHVVLLDTTGAEMAREPVRLAVP